MPDATGDRLREVVEELDKVISDIRTTIFDLQARPVGARGLRAGVLQLASDAAERLGFRPRVRFEGAVDTVVDRETADQLLAVLRESLSNVIRHADAGGGRRDRAVGGRRAGADRVRRRRRPAPRARRAGYGLRNMEARAVLPRRVPARSGARQPRGTLVEWRVPLGLSVAGARRARPARARPGGPSRTDNRSHAAPRTQPCCAGASPRGRHPVVHDVVGRGG